MLQPFPAPAEAVLGQFCLSPSFGKALGGREIQVVTGHASAPWTHTPWKIATMAAQTWPGEQEDAGVSEANSPSGCGCWDLPLQVQGQGQHEAASIP